VTSARNAEDQRLRFVSNWSWDATSAHAPMALCDLLSGEEIPAGSPVSLAAWDVRVLIEVPDDDDTQGREVR
jgi:beta-galactosidase